MKYDKIYLEGIQHKNEEILLSTESLFTLFALQVCENLDLEIIFTYRHENENSSLSKCMYPIVCHDLLYPYTFCIWDGIPKSIQNCFLPAVEMNNDNWIVVGLSASIRHFLSLKSNLEPDHISNNLLGFRKGCLQACAEVSIWTKFCEIDSIEMINDLYNQEQPNKSFIIPKNILRYEHHLTRPPILHNALKKKQKFLSKDVHDKNMLIELRKKALRDLPPLEHKYAEGTDFTIADVLLYCSFFLCFERLKYILSFTDVCPLVLKWLENLEDIDNIKRAKHLLKRVCQQFPSFNAKPNLSVSLPNVPDESLYKCDPDKYKPRWRSFTNQKDIEGIVSKLKKEFVIERSDLNLKEESISEISWKIMEQTCESKFSDLDLIGNNFNPSKLKVYSFLISKSLEWKDYPKAVNPADGELPQSRLKRKCEQLESMAQVVLNIAKNGDIIVDFCAGGGHLGILLAYLLPNCTILLVENKKESLLKANKRVKELKLKNVDFYQCNLDYFRGQFDIGVCLHACGSATDLVLQKCLSNKASFVCCPCCYGSLCSNHIFSYPRSTYYATNINIPLEEFLILGHSADQTHGEDNPKTSQGKECMVFVDYDRLCNAQESGYKTILGIMHPPQCSPKNHVLIGIHSNNL